MSQSRYLASPAVGVELQHSRAESLLMLRRYVREHSGMGTRRATSSTLFKTYPCRPRCVGVFKVSRLF